MPFSRHNNAFFLRESAEEKSMKEAYYAVKIELNRIEKQ